MIIPFGQVTVTAGGTPVRVTANLDNPTTRVGLQSITVQARPANAGIVYVRLGNTPADDRTTRRTVLFIIPQPVSAVQGPLPLYTITLPAVPNGINAADIYLDAASNGDGAIVFGTQG